MYSTWLDCQHSNRKTAEIPLALGIRYGGGVSEAAKASGSSGPSETTSEGYRGVRPSELRAKLLIIFPQSLPLEYFAEATLRRQTHL